MRGYLLATPAVSVALPVAPAPYVYYRGCSLRETAGSTASVVIYDGTSASGPILDQVSLSANGSGGSIIGNAKIARTGIYVQVVSGTVNGEIYFD